MAESTSAEARKFLQDNNIEVGARGKLSESSKLAYAEATGNTVAAPATKAE